MNVELMSVLFFGLLGGFLLLGTPLTFTLGGVSLVFLYFLWGTSSFFMIPSQIFGVMGSFTLVAIPLFVFMAMLLERSGVAEDLYESMYLWFGRINGGLAVGTCVICAVFAAMCGISGAAVVTMGTIALPSMLSRNYDKQLAIGAIMTGGGWGVLIPPSIIMIVYALLSGESVGKMFAGGVLPGLLLLVLVSAYILIRCFFQPYMGPAVPPESRAGWNKKFTSLKSLILPIGIIVMVLGSIVMGLATPTEAAGMGVLGAAIASAVHRKLTRQLISEASLQALRTTGMIMWIIFGAHCFSAAYQALGASQLIYDLLGIIPGGPWGAIIFIQVILFLLAMILDPAGIMMICVPIFVPYIKQLGFDPLWFGILFTINMEIGYMTPPFGFNLFYMKGIAPSTITMADIYRSCIPYVIVSLVGLAIVMMVPELATWLPSVVF